MRLDEAITRATEDVTHLRERGNDCLADAHQLGIEALKRVRDMRISPCTTADEILEGETSEEEV